jgi:hypothetical protein
MELKKEKIERSDIFAVMVIEGKYIGSTLKRSKNWEYNDNSF